MAAIENRYEFVYYLACTNANPNGDPDMGNTPRLDPETMQGYITDVATKRRVRNYVQIAHGDEPGMNLLIQQSTNINRHIAEAKRAAGVEGTSAKDKNAVYAGRQKACQLFYDVRTFGAVMSTGPNAGQVRGPVQIAFGKSLDPILPMDISITRMAVAKEITNGTVEDYMNYEESTEEASLRTMGRKQLIPFGLYEIRGFISANLAAETGFDDHDLEVLFEAVMNMYEHDHSASKGQMDVVSPLIVFKHVGTDTDLNQRAKQAKLGCAPAHKLFDLVRVKRKKEVLYPRSYRDYAASVAMDKVPAGVEIGFKPDAFSPIVWNRLPEEETWLVNDNG